MTALTMFLRMEAHNAEKALPQNSDASEIPAAAIAENHDEAQKIVSEKVFNMRDESGFEYEEKQRRLLFRQQ